jgi:hypothetical protein
MLPEKIRKRNKQGLTVQTTSDLYRGKLIENKSRQISDFLDLFTQVTDRTIIELLAT